MSRLDRKEEFKCLKVSNGFRTNSARTEGRVSNGVKIFHEKHEMIKNKRAWIGDTP
ncbi:hypothetical protein M1N00_02570 [Thermodesulfovibrionales bacterium]|nr:hypothetical protein [Thermodesulfovibrionales bacterium]